MTVGMHPGHNPFTLFATVPIDPVHPTPRLLLYPGDDLLCFDTLRTIKNRGQQVLIRPDLPLFPGKVAQRGMGKDPDAAKDEKYGLPEFFHAVHGFLQGPCIFPRSSQEEIVGDMHTRPAGTPLGGNNIFHTKRFAVPSQWVNPASARPS